MLGRLSALVLTLALAIGAIPLFSAQAVPQGLVLAVGETVYEGGTFTFVENLVVPAGATLVFRDAVVYLDAPEWCPSRGTAGYCQPSILLAGGTLVIEDSLVDSHLAESGDEGAGWNVAGVRGRLVVTGSTLTHYRGLGTQLPGDEPSLVEGNLFLDGRGALAFTRGAVALVQDNAFHGGRAGVLFTDSPSTLARNAFLGVGAQEFGRAIDVQSTQVGDKALQAMTRVEGNVVDGAWQAMLNLNGFPNEIRNNVFRGAQLGLAVGVSVGDAMWHREPPVIEGNLFEGNRDAILLYTSGVFTPLAKPQSFTLAASGNSFVGTTCRDVAVAGVHSLVSVTFDLRANWWGTPEGPQARGPACPTVPEGALVAPWLQSAPDA